jgi:WD40 repeat protein
MPIEPLSAQEVVSESVGYDQVQSVFRRRCITCHNIDETRGDLDLSNLTTTMVGSSSGPVVVPGKPLESTIYTVTAHLTEPMMPPNSSKIPARELDLIRRWIEGMEVVNSNTNNQSNQNPATNMGSTNQIDEIEAEPFSSSSVDNNWVPIKPLLRQTAVAALAVHPSEPLFAVAGNGQIVFGDLRNGSWRNALSFTEGQVTNLRFNREGSLLLAAGGVGGLSGTVLAFDLESGTKRFQVADELDSILAMDISPNGQFVAVGGPAKVVRVYSTQSGESVFAMRNHTDWILSIAYSPDGLLLATADRFGGVFVWNAASGELFHTLVGHQGSVRAMNWSADGESLVTACEDGKLRTWEMHHGQLIDTHEAGVAAILDFDRHPGGKSITAARTGKVTLWSDSGELHGQLELNEQVDRIAFSGDGSSFVTADAQGNIAMHSFDGLELINRLSLPVDNSGLQALLTNLKSRARIDLELPSVSDFDQSVSNELAELNATIAKLTSRVELIERQSARLQVQQKLLDESRRLSNLLNTEDFDSETARILETLQRHIETQIESTKRTLQR